MADTDLELRGRGWFCFACPASFFPSLISPFFTQNKGGGGGGRGWVPWVAPRVLPLFTALV